MLHGLVGAAELNGQRATIKCFDQDLQRYVVQMTQSAELKRLRLENIQRIPPRGAAAKHQKPRVAAMPRAPADASAAPIINEADASAPAAADAPIDECGPVVADVLAVVSGPAVVRAAKRKKRAPGYSGGAYGVFFEQNRERFQVMCTGEPQRAVLILASKLWKEMGDAQRSPYQEEFDSKKAAVEEATMRRAIMRARAQRRRAKVKYDDVDDADRARKTDSEGANIKRVQLENVQTFFAKRSEVVLHGLSGASELNGQRGRIDGYDADAGRYLVRLGVLLKVRECKRVRPENLTSFFPKDSDVLVMLEAEDAYIPAKVFGYNMDEGGVYLVRTPRRHPLDHKVSQACVRPSYTRGTCVILHGLQRADLNGAQGKVDKFDEAEKRYVVSLANSPDGKRLKPENVEAQIATGVQVVLAGLQGCPRLNGTLAWVQSFDPIASRYVVQLQGGSEGGSEQNRLAKVWAAAKCDVVLHSLMKMPELNGQHARVITFDEAEGSCSVRLCSRPAETREVPPEHLAFCFAVGSEVFVKGDKAFSKRHGHRGFVEKFLPLSGKYAVRLTTSSSVQLVRSGMLCTYLPARTKVLITGFPRAPELDGHLAQIEGFDKKEGRYLVRLRSTSAKLVLPAHLRLPLELGVGVVIDGLEQASHLNGRFARVTRYDDVRGRCVVRLRCGSTSESKRVRQENIYKVEDLDELQADDLADVGYAGGIGGSGQAGGDEDDVDSVDSVGVADGFGAPASPSSSSDGASSDSVGRHRKRARLAPQVSRMLLKQASAEVVRGAERQLRREAKTAAAEAVEGAVFQDGRLEETATAEAPQPAELQKEWEEKMSTSEVVHAAELQVRREGA